MTLDLKTVEMLMKDGEVKLMSGEYIESEKKRICKEFNDAVSGRSIREI